jgi:hypothetical protein
VRRVTPYSYRGLCFVRLSKIRVPDTRDVSRIDVSHGFTGSKAIDYFIQVTAGGMVRGNMGYLNGTHLLYARQRGSDSVLRTKSHKLACVALRCAALHQAGKLQHTEWQVAAAQMLTELTRPWQLERSISVAISR